MGYSPWSHKESDDSAIKPQEQRLNMNDYFSHILSAPSFFLLSFAFVFPVP